MGLVARSAGTVERAAAALANTGVDTAAATADVADEAALRVTLESIVERLGVPDVVVYNAAAIQWDAFGELTAAQLLDTWAVNVGGAITAVAHLAPRMAETGRGTILITGGMPVPIPEGTSLSLGKAGVRALTELLAAKWGQYGLHVATVTVGGAVAPGTAFDPDDIADEYWRLHVQPRGEWEREIVYARSDMQRIANG